MRSLLLLVVIVSLLLVAALWFARTGPAPAPPTAPAAPTLRQEVYVWQRAWTDDVKDAVTAHGGAFARVVVLGAQISWDKPAEPHVFHVAVDWRRLKSAAQQVGVGIRIGAYTGAFEGPAAQLVAAVAGELCEKARRAGVELAEIQLDFDAAASKLDGYRTWVQAAKTQTHAVPVHITALPSWLRQRAFAGLAAEAGEYVLQVHSLDRPARLGDRVALCDPAAARDAVARASRLGVPFRIALPTYGYVLVFDDTGKYCSLEAEGPERTWPVGYQKRWMGSQSAELVDLCGAWQARRPAAMAGIIWYRLPIAADRYNWRWATLAAVLDGRTPQADVVVDVVRQSGSLVEISLRNQGQDDARGPMAVWVTWSRGELQASDALGGFAKSTGAGQELRLVGLTAAGARLAPGECRKVAWLRFAQDTEVQAYVDTQTR